MPATVLMPEAPVDKHYLFSGSKNKVWTAFNIVGMKTVPVTHAMHNSSHDHLRLGVSASDARHTFASRRRGKYVVACHDRPTR